MRLGVLGGSFDPVHAGHLIAAEFVREAFQLDRVLFLPANQPPHKPEPVASPELRMKMVDAAIRSHIGFAASDIDIRRGGVSYTVDTLEDLSRENPGAKLYFIIGADLAAELPTWRCWDRVSALATFVAVHRPGADLSRLPANLRSSVKLLEIPGIEISSSLVRTRVSAGKSIRYLVPAPVQDLIERELVYRNGPA